MNNKGQITIFLSLIMSVLIFLGFFAVKICKYYNARSRAAQVVNSAISDVKSEFNSYIYEHYHILLFDKTDYGKGEAAVEEFLYENIKNNLSDDQKEIFVAITDFDLISDNNYEALKSQINDYSAYAALENSADTILSKTNGKEAALDKNLEANMDADINDTSSDSDNEVKSDNNHLGDDNDDPRDFTKTMGKKGILLFVVPNDMEISNEIIDLSECPTMGRINLAGFYNMNDKFDSYSRLKSDLKQNTSWNNELINAGCGLAYAREVFNCAVNQNVNEDTVFKFEMEYLICGRASDYMNLKSTVKRIISIRFSIDFAYLLTDTSKMSRVKSIAYSLSFATAIPEPVLKYLIAGCWAYVEAVSDTRELLKGNKVEFKKTGENWKTDIDNLEKSFMSDSSEQDDGMIYEDYLLILMAVNMDEVYPRMLDIIQLNTRQFYPSFKISNAAVGLTVDASIEYEDSVFDFSISGGY